MANNSNSKTSFDNMKYEIAGQLGINLKQGYNGDLPSRDAGKIGGNIVKKVFQSYTGNSYPTEKSSSSTMNQ
ncbi:MAG: alpha/beta-type small acid-soluble spore protein [Clostridia bacterium]|nr:alpha/beta-type small acid-soluble spore protein [Clostridia bacterium]